MPALAATLAAATHGPVAYGPTGTTQAGVDVPFISAHLYQASDFTLVADLPDTWDRRWQELLNDAGAASLTIAYDDPALAAITDGSVIRLDIDGWAAFAFIVRNLTHESVAPGEEAAENVTVSGPGHITVLADGLVYPSRGAGSLPAEDNRLFSWQAVDYSDTWWDTAVALVNQCPGNLTFPSGWGGPLATSTGPNGSYWESMLANWPAPDAYWIWANVTDVSPLEWAPAGPCYFRATFTVPAGVVRFQYFVCFDALGDLYIDGQKMASATYGAEPDRVNIYTDTIDITPGTHSLAAYLENDVDPEGDRIHNPGGLLFAGYGVDSVGQRGASPIVVSDGSWRMLAYPASPPGMTPGEVLRHVVTEAQARGCFPQLTLAFTDVVDTVGVPWPVVGEIGTQVGTDLWTFARELTTTYVDLWLPPSAWTLCAWVKGGRGTDTAVSLHAPTDPTNPWSGNIARLQHQVQRS